MMQLLLALRESESGQKFQCNKVKLGECLITEHYSHPIYFPVHKSNIYNIKLGICVEICDELIDFNGKRNEIKSILIANVFFFS